VRPRTPNAEGEILVPSFPAVLGVGEEAPDFTAVVADGSSFTLSSLRGKPVVLYFYPKANTLGCTVEARGFTEHYSEFSGSGVAVVGVSVDTVEDQRRFREKCDIPYPLVADHNKAVARRYGVLGLFGVAKRVTFFLGPDGRVEEVVEGLSPGPHLRRALGRLGRAATS
jgi:thioredoxin-dependent peroxiredoxin